MHVRPVGDIFSEHIHVDIVIVSDTHDALVCVLTDLGDRGGEIATR